MAFEFVDEAPTGGGFEFVDEPQAQKQPVTMAEVGNRKLPTTWETTVTVNGQQMPVRGIFDSDARAYLVNDQSGMPHYINKNTDGSLGLKPYKIRPELNTGDALKYGAARGVVRTLAGVKGALNQAAEGLASTDFGGALDRFGQRIGLDSAADVALRNTAARREADKLEAPLLDTTAGQIGNVVGTAAALAPTMLIPGANTYKGAAAIGAGTGAILAEPEERMEGAAWGAAGGLGGKALGDVIGSAIQAAARGIKALPKGAQSEREAVRLIDEALAQRGFDVKSMSAESRNLIQDQVKNALRTGANLDDAAFQRMMDIQAVGGRGTQGIITRDPQQLALEHTLRGVSGAGSELADIATGNNAALVAALNKMGASGAADDYVASKGVADTLKQFVESNNQRIGSLYKAARNAEGRPAELDVSEFSRMANEALDKNMKGYFLSPEIRTLLNDFSTGKTPLTVETMDVFKTILAAEQRGATNPNARAAAGLVRDALESTPLRTVAREAIPNALPSNIPSTSADLNPAGQSARDAFDLARSESRYFKTLVEKTPALRDVVDGIEPDKFFQKHVQGANVDDLRRTLTAMKAVNKDSVNPVKAKVLEALKTKALGGQTDEVGNFSPSSFQKALKAWPDEKLKLLFSAKEVDQLRTIGRAANWMDTAPKGAAINRSNTAANSYNLLMALLDKIKVVPFAKSGVIDPAESFMATRAIKPNIPVTRAAAGASPIAGEVGRLGGSAYAAQQ